MIPRLVNCSENMPEQIFKGWLVAILITVMVIIIILCWIYRDALAGEKEDIQKDLQLLGTRSFALDQEERAVFFERESVKRLIQEKRGRLQQIQSEEQKAKAEKEKSGEKK